MAIITDRLRQVLDARDPSRVDISIEAEPGEGPAVRDALNGLGVGFDSVNVRRKSVFNATVTQSQLQQLDGEPSVAIIDHSATFSPLGAVDPGRSGGGGLIGEAIPSSDMNRITLRDAIERMNVPKAWEQLGNRGDGVSFGVVDTPIAQRHEALRSSVKGTESNTGNGLHGTWVTSALVADRFETAEGVIQGAAPNADVYAHGALSGGGASLTEISEGINYCIEQEVDIINLSFGGAHSEILRNVVREAVDAGIVVVSSIGNSGPGLRSSTCPAHHSEVLAVGSADTDGSPAAFSSRGPGWNGETKPDVVAFGGGSLLQGGEQLITESVLGAAPPNGSQYLVGTSMAGPQVAGIAGLRAAAQKEG